MNLFTIISALFALASLVCSAPYRICQFGRADIVALRGLLNTGDSTEAFTAKFADCRFEPSQFDEPIMAALEMVVVRDRMDLYQFFVERTRIDASWVDGVYSDFLIHTLANNSMAFFLLFWHQDFAFADVERFYWHLNGSNIAEIKQLITAVPKRAVELIPDHCSFLSWKVEAALRAIDLISHCTTVNSAAAAKFDGTQLLLYLLRRYRHPDAEMVRLVEALWNLGVKVGQECFDVLDARSPRFDLPRTRETLQCYQSIQDEIKEPDMD